MRAGASRRGISRTGTILAPVVFGILALLLWQLIVVGFGIKPYVLPSPLSIADRFGQSIGTVWTGTRVTGLNALIGLVFGGVVGIVGAILAALVRVLDQLSAAVVTALSVVPIVALAPVLYTMFGAQLEIARVIVAAIAVFVPVFINSLRGLRQVRPVQRDLMRAYAASGWQTARTVTIPSALPFMFTGLRIASSLAVISAIVAEYFGGPRSGIGSLITSAASGSNYARAWAFVVGAIIVGLVFFAATLAIERFSTRHRPA